MNKAFTNIHLGIFKIIDKFSKKLLLLDKNFITVFGDPLNILKNILGIFSGFGTSSASNRQKKACFGSKKGYQ